MDLSGNHRIARVCTYCEAEARELYHLPLVRQVAEPLGMTVCRFCYIRLCGVKPRRSSAVGSGGSLPAR